MLRTAILIPIYEPDAACLPFLSLFKEGDFDAFLVIDDGSGERFDDVFNDIANKTVFTVLRYPKNRGKGYALKYGIERLHENADLIITADGDGQHSYKDILRLKEEAFQHPDSLILGTRAFKKGEVPLASKIGHVLANAAFTGLTHQHVSDTQTGLRSIPKRMFHLALTTPGNRYDYEHDFLIEVGRHSKVLTIDIEAIYIDKNSGTHFRPVLDTLFIHKRVLFAFLAIAVAYAADMILFDLFSRYVFTANIAETIFNSTIAAGSIAGFIGFLILFFLVFDRKQSFKGRLWRTGLLFAIYVSTCAVFIYVFKFIPIPLIWIKFILSFATLFCIYLFRKLFFWGMRKRSKLPQAKTE